MDTSILVVDTESVVNCFNANLSETRITLRCSPAFAQVVRTLVEEGGENLGGVVFRETGNSWYELVPRTHWGPTNRRPFSDLDKQLFLQYAFIAIRGLLERLDLPTVFETQPKRELALVSQRTIVVNARPSSAGFRPNQPTASSLRGLRQKFSHRSHRG